MFILFQQNIPQFLFYFLKAAVIYGNFCWIVEFCFIVHVKLKTCFREVSKMHVLRWHPPFAAPSNPRLNIINGNIIDVILKYDVTDNANKDEPRTAIDVDKIAVTRGKKQHNIYFILLRYIFQNLFSRKKWIQ